MQFDWQKTTDGTLNLIAQYDNGRGCQFFSLRKGIRPSLMTVLIVSSLYG